MVTPIAADNLKVDRLIWPAAGLSLVAGVVHLFVSPEYLRQWWGYGFFFIIAGLAQITYALGLLVQPMLYDVTKSQDEGPRAMLHAAYLAGVWGNGAIIVLYTVTRTLGVPFVGPAANIVLPVTPLSLLATLAEVGEVILLLLLARWIGRRRAGAS